MFDSSLYDAGSALVEKYEDQLRLCNKYVVISNLDFLGSSSPYFWAQWSSYKVFRKYMSPFASESEIKALNRLFWKTAILKCLWNGAYWFLMGAFMAAGYLGLLVAAIKV
jgi:hypothetical protein